MSVVMPIVIAILAGIGSAILFKRLGKIGDLIRDISLFVINIFVIGLWFAAFGSTSIASFIADQPIFNYLILVSAPIILGSWLGKLKIIPFL